MRSPIQYENLPHFLEGQRGQFRAFLERGLPEICEASFPLYYMQRTLTLRPRKYVLRRTLNRTTYHSAVFLPLQIRGQTQPQPSMASSGLAYTYVGHLPLLTNGGFFHVNKNRRILLPQLVRSPGNYLKIRIYPYNLRTYASSFYSEAGCWISVFTRRRYFKTKKEKERDAKNKDIASMNPLQKRELYVQLRSIMMQVNYLTPFPLCIFVLTFAKVYPPKQYPIGWPSSWKKVCNSLNDKRYDTIHQLPPSSPQQILGEEKVIQRGLNLFNKFLPPGWPTTRYLFIIYIRHLTYRHLYTMRKRRSHLYQSIRFFYTWFFCPHFYALNGSGRRQLNRKFQAATPMACPVSVLQPQDFIFAGLQVFFLALGRAKVDSVDHLENQSLQSVYRQFQTLFETTVEETFQNVILTDLLANYKEQRRTRIKIDLHRTVRPSYFVAGRRWNRTRKKVSRQPHLFSYVSAEPFNTAVSTLFGQNPLAQLLDATNSLARLTQARKLSRLGVNGLTQRAGVEVRSINLSHFTRLCPIETPEGKNVGLVHTLPLGARLTERSSLLGYFHGSKAKRSFLFSANVSFGHATRLHTTQVHPRSTQALSAWGTQTLPIQTISVATSLIPFLEHNDANRSLMGSNMQRQSLLLRAPAKALIGTGIEQRVIGAQSLHCHESGQVLMVTSDLVVVKGRHMLFYSLYTGSPTYLSPKVWKASVFAGEWVCQGESLADEQGTDELSLGQNILVAYMPWRGFNFEDAIVLNHQVVDTHVFTSVAVQEVTMASSGVFIRRSRARESDRRGFIKAGSAIQAGSCFASELKVEAGQIDSPSEHFFRYLFEQRSDQPCLAKANHVWTGEVGKVLRVSFFPYSKKKVLSLGAFSQLTKIKLSRDLVQDWLRFRCCAGQLHVTCCLPRALKIGDKLAGRHGNKGIVSLLLHTMPYVHSGHVLQMLLNPLGVPSRMNLGQIFECLIGLVAFFEGQQIKITAFDERFGLESSRNFALSRIYKSVPIYFELTTPGKVFLFNGVTHQAFTQPVTLGVAYMLRLVHQVDDKIHARATGAYNKISQQPLRGKASLGGQRVGEMELWAFEGYGSSYLLQELVGTKSDSLYGRSKLYSSLIFSKNPEIPPDPERPESLLVFLHELKSMYLKSEYYWS